MVQLDLDAPIPKELGLPSLEGGMLGSQNRKKESKMAVAKRQRKKKARENGTKENSRTRVSTTGETDLLASPIYIGQAQRKETKHFYKKRSQD